MALAYCHERHGLALVVLTSSVRPGGERSTNNSSMAMHAKGCMGIMRIQWNREVGEYISSMNTQSGEGAVNPRPSTQTGMEWDR